MPAEPGGGRLHPVFDRLAQAAVAAKWFMTTSVPPGRSTRQASSSARSGWGMTLIT